MLIIGYIFKGFKSNINISSGTIYSILKDLCIECNIDGSLVGTHSFRKTCGTDLYGRTNDIAAVSHKLGHKKDSKSTKFYIGQLQKRQKIACL